MGIHFSVLPGGVRSLRPLRGGRRRLPAKLHAALRGYELQAGEKAAAERKVRKVIPAVPMKSDPAHDQGEPFQAQDLPITQKGGPHSTPAAQRRPRSRIRRKPSWE